MQTVNLPFHLSGGSTIACMIELKGCKVETHFFKDTDRCQIDVTHPQEGKACITPVGETGWAPTTQWLYDFLEEIRQAHP